MLKKKKVVTYHLAGTDDPITHKSLEKYNNLSKFFVTSDGLVVPITPYTDHNSLSHIIGGKYMYKEQLVELIFNS